MLQPEPRLAPADGVRAAASSAAAAAHQLPWDAVAVGLNGGGDETSAFGRRNETGTSLYRVETLASIAPAAATPGTAPGEDDVENAENSINPNAMPAAAAALCPPAAGPLRAKLPHVSACASSERLAVAVGPQVHVMDASGSTLITSLNLGRSGSIATSTCCHEPGLTSTPSTTQAATPSGCAGAAMATCCLWATGEHWGGG